MQRPNILVFMTDQQRADSLYRAYMPHVEQLQREGVTFTNSYTVAPHCCPSRATFFSGLYPSQHGVWNNVKFGNALSRGFYEGVRLFSEDLKDAGYRMRFSGKWHASVMEGPLDRGFDMMDEPVPRPGTRCKYVIGDLKKKAYRHTRPDTWEWGLYDNYRPLEDQARGEAEIRREGYPPFILYGEQENPFQDEDVVGDAVRGLLNMERSAQPWFYFVGTLGPHDPYYLPQKYLDMYPIEDIRLPDNFADRMEDKPGLYRRIRDRFDQLSEEELDPLSRVGTDGGLEETLFRFLSRQLYSMDLEEETAETVRYLASCLDERGYLTIPLGELSQSGRVPLPRLERALDILRGLEPAGVGADSLSQCLALQLERAGVDGPALAIVRDHLEALAKRHDRAIAAKWKPALRLGGALIFEVGLGQAPSVEDILYQNGYEDVKILPDTQGILRVVEGTVNN